MVIELLSELFEKKVHEEELVQNLAHLMALSQTNLRKAKVNSRLKVTTRNTKLSDFACLKNIRHADGTILSQKYVSEAERETAKNKRELDVQCHSTQTHKSR